MDSFLCYAGLIFTGALVHNEFYAHISTTALPNGIGSKTLGNTSHLLVNPLVGSACFTTAMGIVSGTVDFMKCTCPASQKAYTITAIFGCGEASASGNELIPIGA
ncbi:MAG: branched-chain amino acid transport system II carrier protein [Maribacter sp.]|uniref:branched-chain amino acid transport system II carrier protein n=1 Tax=Maribacter sp. TaxID=1897614 RepID=UPI003C73DA6C